MFDVQELALDVLWVVEYTVAQVSGYNTAQVAVYNFALAVAYNIELVAVCHVAHFACNTVQVVE